MDQESAIRVLKASQLASDYLTTMLSVESDYLSDQEFIDLRMRVAKVISIIFEFLIEPAVEESPGINPYRPDGALHRPF